MHSVITRKGQVTIPKEIRDHLKAKEGEKVAFVMRGDRSSSGWCAGIFSI